MQILKKILIFKLTKGYHQNSNLLYIIIFIICHFFFNEKGLTLIVLSPFNFKKSQIIKRIYSSIFQFVYNFHGFSSQT
jgi:hypothetical protein